ncbi:C40 family peptidase [Candidatus Desantisbacteria bacterium]|nr:C40 family peptidase [Candidatus Desantisbacteria bacterium]
MNYTGEKKLRGNLLLLKVKSQLDKWIEENHYTKELISVSPAFDQINEHLILSGEVLLKKQKNEIEKLLSENYKVVNNLKVISSPDYKNIRGWGKTIETLDVRKDKTSKKISTQITEDDNAFKILYADENESLIQLEDSTLGWIYNDKIKFLPPKNYWGKITCARKNEVMDVPSLDPLFKSAMEYLMTPYLLGGKSINGVDCSGLMQIIFKKAFKLILPKHALDQFKTGIRIPIKEIKPGDLIFARAKGKNIFHVGLIYKSKKNSPELFVIHAGLYDKKVVCVSLNEFYVKYIPAGARRIVATGKN